MSILHVNHIKAAVLKRFDGLLDLSDVGRVPAADLERHLQTRSLAAFCVAEMAKTDDTVAAGCVVDGSADNGIDAFYFDNVEHVGYLVQSKFIASGNGTIDVGDMHKFVQGVRDFFEGNLSSFGKLEDKSADIMRVLGDARATFKIIAAYTGQQELDPQVMRPMQELVEGLNDDDDLVEFVPLNQKALHDIVTALALGDSIDLRIMLHEFGTMKEPYRAYYGQMAVSDMVQWAKHKDRLYHRNIRGFKGSTDVNEGIVTTIKKLPQHFWYFNNGITIVCSKVKKEPLGGNSRTSGVFECFDASVVNGAQTVGSIQSALSGGAAGGDQARVMVRIISLENCPADFGRDLTKATNTQNRIDRRDFASLDPEQKRLRSEMLLSFGKEYAYRSGEVEPTTEAGCTLDEATVALACAHTELGLSVQAKREVGKLYENIEHPPYVLLFNPSVSAHKLWRAVEIGRIVENALKAAQENADAKRRLIAIHGNRFILHMVFRTLGDSAFAEVQIADKAQAAALDQYRKVADAVAEVMPTAYAWNLFKNVTKCKSLVAHISTGVTTGARLFD
jgi:hypothetical protein